MKCMEDGQQEIIWMGAKNRISIQININNIVSIEKILKSYICNL